MATEESELSTFMKAINNVPVLPGKNNYEEDECDDYDELERQKRKHGEISDGESSGIGGLTTDDESDDEDFYVPPEEIPEIVSRSIVGDIIKGALELVHDDSCKKIMKPRTCFTCNGRYAIYGYARKLPERYCKDCKIPGMATFQNKSCYCREYQATHSIGNGKALFCRECCPPGGKKKWPIVKPCKCKVRFLTHSAQGDYLTCDSCGAQSVLPDDNTYEPIYLNVSCCSPKF